MGIPILVRQHLYIEMAPSFLCLPIFIVCRIIKILFFMTSIFDKCQHTLIMAIHIKYQCESRNSLDRVFSRLLEYMQDHWTHLPLDKMSNNLADDIFNCIFLNENDRILIQISLKYVPSSPIDNKSALCQLMALHQTGAKPLPEPMMTQFIDAYMRHKGEMS